MTKREPPTLVLASTNAAKRRAVVQAWERLFGQTPRVLTVAVRGPEGLPVGEANLQAWAARRVAMAQAHFPQADFWLAIEGGIRPYQAAWWMTAWVLVQDRRGRRHGAWAAAFPLPQALTRRLRQGQTLAQAVAEVYTERARERQRLGLIGVLTGGRLTRQNLYVHPVMLALLPWLDDLR